ncbi:MAG TPA: L-2-hydroxyglutarate oxidase [Candidatus Binatia bacterium]|nr:L-2-hydroxyglutarate oxidase [Candidatus Binatia bacterium]
MIGERPTVVVGAGLVGLAVARQLLIQSPGRPVSVLETEATVAAHQSGRNSGVVHSGIYYAPGSISARLCSRGGAQLREFCVEAGIPVRPLGKLIVATSPEEARRLPVLLERARINGIPGVTIVGSRGIREIEPNARGTAALHVPGTSSVDFVAVAAALADDIRRRGGTVRLGCEVRGGRVRADGISVLTATEPLEADRVILCPGLQADRLARCFGAPREPEIVPFRGSFWRLRPDAARMVRGHLYPVPDPGLPFLGVHASRRHDGEVWLGPNAVLALSRVGYRRGQLEWRTLREEASSPGLRRLMLRHWRTGLWELARDRSRQLLVASAGRLLPEITTADMAPGLSGVRAQALSRDGRLVSDFVFWRRGPLLAVRNAPSPAATASLAIAEHIVSVFTETARNGA